MALMEMEEAAVEGGGGGGEGSVESSGYVVTRQRAQGSHGEEKPLANS